MFQRLRKHINPATILALAALVFAATGGAYAATGGGDSSPAKASASVGHGTATAAKKKKKSSYVITSTKQISPAVLKSLQGKAGANGVNGATGPAGAAGSAGAKGETGAGGTPGSPGTPGDKGEPGNTGSPGSAGSPGNSPVGHEFTGSRVGSTCTSGGVEFAIASGTTTYACNGTTGFTKTLPAGETETGTWAFSYPAAKAREEIHTPISFSIPLAPEVAGEPKAVHAEFGPSANCTGSDLVPSAEPGYLCVYTSALVNVSGQEIQDLEGSGAAATFGAILYFEETEAAGEAFGFGSWAVTAPE